MFNIKADFIFTKEKESGPIIDQNPFRPLLWFSGSVIRSGLVVMEEGEVLYIKHQYYNRPIGIYFYKDLDTKKEFYPGREFKMTSGLLEIGHGVITEVLGEDV